MQNTIKNKISQVVETDLAKCQHHRANQLFCSHCLRYYPEDSYCSCGVEYLRACRKVQGQARAISINQ